MNGAFDRALDGRSVVHFNQVGFYFGVRVNFPHSHAQSSFTSCSDNRLRQNVAVKKNKTVFSEVKR